MVWCVCDLLAIRFVSSPRYGMTLVTTLPTMEVADTTSTLLWRRSVGSCYPLAMFKHRYIHPHRSQSSREVVL